MRGFCTTFSSKVKPNKRSSAAWHYVKVQLVVRRKEQPKGAKGPLLPFIVVGFKQDVTYVTLSLGRAATRAAEAACQRITAHRKPKLIEG